ncbi:hypothetical protein P691DRAFT_766296 [Macrolepiota fuliginosa MF-IS2]|uniref:Uncharacterized protein n=1 Tax=Macrolepiota fuliginosa MF-IS2 TaxID=1400762 RepID=A0A9P6BXG2_9AGAR|nr:hypothetical protein P691DRAFT_766296 [Macrolepiota fuliginosa MF-IS2]
MPVTIPQAFPIAPTGPINLPREMFDMSSLEQNQPTSNVYTAAPTELPAEQPVLPADLAEQSVLPTAPTTLPATLTELPDPSADPPAGQTAATTTTKPSPELPTSAEPLEPLADAPAKFPTNTAEHLPELPATTAEFPTEITQLAMQILFRHRTHV